VSNTEGLMPIIQDLIRATHLMAKELERFVSRAEQSIGHVGYVPQFNVIASEMTELLARTKKLALVANDVD
jgi:hypothetical protein